MVETNTFKKFLLFKININGDFYLIIDTCNYFIIPMCMNLLIDLSLN